MANPLPPPRRVAVPVLVKDGKPCTAGYGKGFDTHPMAPQMPGMQHGALLANAATSHHHHPGFVGQHSFATHQPTPMGLAPVSSVITPSHYYMQNTWW